MRIERKNYNILPGKLQKYWHFYEHDQYEHLASKEIIPPGQSITIELAKLIEKALENTNKNNWRSRRKQIDNLKV